MNNLTIEQQIGLLLIKADKDPFLKGIIAAQPDAVRKPIFLNQQIVGFYSPKTSNYLGETYWRTGAIYVLPEYRRKGLASNVVTNFFKDKDKGMALIEPENTASLATFMKAGFYKDELITHSDGNKYWRMLKESNKKLAPAFLSWK